MGKNKVSFNSFYKEIKPNVKKDVGMMEDDIKEGILKISAIKQKYINKFHVYKNNYQNLIIRADKYFKKSVLELMEGKSLINYDEKKAKKHVELDEGYIEMQKDLKEYEKILSYLEDVIKTITEKGYQIKNYIEYIKLQRDIN